MKCISFYLGRNFILPASFWLSVCAQTSDRNKQDVFPRWMNRGWLTKKMWKKKEREYIRFNISGLCLFYQNKVCHQEDDFYIQERSSGSEGDASQIRNAHPQFLLRKISLRGGGLRGMRGATRGMAATRPSAPAHARTCPGC